MEYRTIFTMKESEKATVVLADVEGMEIPSVVKCLQGANPDIYRLLCHAPNSHIPQVYIVEERGGELLVAEEYVDGENLEEYLEKQTPGDAEKLDLALQLCEAVAFLHSVEPPVIHRDIKPSNILITGKGSLKLIDFDASRQYKELQNSGDTRLLGTVEYAPPEQFGYSQTDVRSDIYSMGVVFHEMHPTENKRLAEQWEKIAEKCTSFDPKNRYQNVEELAKEIEKLKHKKKLKLWKLTGPVGVLAVGMAAVLVSGMWIKTNRESGGDTIVVTGTPRPTETQTPVVTPEPTPVPTPTPVPSPSPTPTPTVTPSPSATPGPTPTMSEKMLLWTQRMETPVQISSSKYNYYKAEAENAELIFYNDVAEQDITFVGGMCYQYETEEYIYIPENMLSGGPNYYGVSDEFLKGLEPGLYYFYIAREAESGYGGFMGRSAEIHSEEKRVPQPDQLLIDTEETFYSDYQREAVFVVWCDVLSRINGLYTLNQNSEKEAVDASGYNIAMDGKVLLINKDFLVRYQEEESVFFTVTFDDGKTQEIEVKMIEGLPAKVSPTPGPTLTLTPSPTPTPTPSPTPQAAELYPVPTSINQHYYKGLAEETELILRHGSDTTRLPATWDGECYDYATGETYYIPMDMIEIGPGYIWLLDGGLATLEPSIYYLTVNMYYGSDTQKKSTNRVLKIYDESEYTVESLYSMASSTNYFFKEEPQDFVKNVLSTSTNRFVGVYAEIPGMEAVEVSSEWYDIFCNGKVMIIQKEFLQQYYEEGQQINLIYHFDDGKQQTVVINYEESR